MLISLLIDVQMLIISVDKQFSANSTGVNYLCRQTIFLELGMRADGSRRLLAASLAAAGLSGSKFGRCRAAAVPLHHCRGRGRGDWGEQGGWTEERGDWGRERRDWEDDRWVGGQKDDWQGEGWLGWGDRGVDECLASDS